MPTQDIYNYRKVSDNLITSGMPTADQLRDAAAEGFQAVINLATYTPGHSLPEEADLVQSLGMDYYTIPVEWENPTHADFEAFEKLLLSLGSTRLLIHCAANYRVSAFYSLYAQKHAGWSAEQAQAFRRPIWEGSSYPTWEKLIRELSEV